jgi:hypothetical protein
VNKNLGEISVGKKVQTNLKNYPLLHNNALCKQAEEIGYKGVGDDKQIIPAVIEDGAENAYEFKFLMPMSLGGVVERGIENFPGDSDGYFRQLGERGFITFIPKRKIYKKFKHY